jgi:SNF2 family DNA or RNA helicase
MSEWKPHGYQRKAMKLMVSQMCAGILLDPGMGKSSVTYGAFKVLKQRGMVQRMLIIAPLRPATSTWPREAQKWDEFKGLNVHVLHGPGKETLLAQPHDVSIVNPDGLRWLLGGRDEKTGRALPGAAKRAGVTWDMLVVDESTRFKHANTQRFKTLRPHLSRFRRRYILTGSPAPNGLLDLFGQIFILDCGRALGKYMTEYRRTYFNETGFGGYTYVLKAGAEERIREAIAPLVLRMQAEDYLELPPLIGVDPPNVVEVELPDDARRAYGSMEKLMLAELESGTVTAANAAAATMKCRQIANGGIYNEDHTTAFVHDAKTEAVADIVEELSGKPALIAYEFAHDLERLRREFPDAPHLGGGVTSKSARETEDRWNAGLLPVLLVQPQSAAHGLNLQEVGAELIWYSLTWDLELYEQLIRRLWRQGQRERVVVHHIIARGTVDEAILRALRVKDRTQRSLLQELRAYAYEKRR